MEPLKEVIIKNSNLIYSIANKFNYSDIDDLFQVGCIGMMEAYKNFDESRGVKFTTFSYPYILGRITEFIRENHTIKLSRDMTRAKRKLEKVKIYLSQELMKEPTNEEISNYLNMPLENVNILMNYKGEGLSLDEFYLDDLSLYDVIGSDHNYDNLIFLKQQFESLEEPEKTIMYYRYFEDMTQSEVADSLGLSQVNVSRKEKKVLTKLRKTFN